MVNRCSKYIHKKRLLGFIAQALSLKFPLNQNNEFCGLDDEIVKNSYKFRNKYLINFKVCLIFDVH